MALYYNVNEGQSLIDIACEIYGDAEMVVKLAQDNDLSLTNDLNGNMLLAYDETITAGIDTSTYFRLNSLNVITTDLEPYDLIEHSIEEHTAQEHN